MNLEFDQIKKMVHNNIFKIYYDYIWRKEIAQKKKKWW